MRKLGLILISCSLICVGAYRWGEARWEEARQAAMQSLYDEVLGCMFPVLDIYESGTHGILFQDVAHFFMPFFEETYVVREEIPQETGDNEAAEENPTEIPTLVPEQMESVTVSGKLPEREKQVIINRLKLQDFDYLLQNFFQVDSTTTVGRDLLNAEELLGMDMSIENHDEGPQILIYHTHSQEGYRDSVAQDASTTIVGVGDYLEQLLEERYGVNVLHHKGVYDLPTRDNAYSQALPELEKLLQENPTIEVIIDLHRDGVAEDRHLVTEIDGKQTAKLMFFNGLSYTTAQGDLDYLPNAYIKDNLAFSMQLQLAAEEYYPGLNRKIYLKGYRYNLHLRAKSILVEVGAQTNTLEEAKNAMEPLSDILGKVLYNSENE